MQAASGSQMAVEAVAGVPRGSGLEASFTKGGRERVQRRAAISAGQQLAAQHVPIPKEPAVGRKRKMASNKDLEPAKKSRKKTTSNSPHGAANGSSKTSPARSLSGSPASKARKGKGVLRAEPSQRNVSTSKMNEADAVKMVRERIQQFGNTYIGAVKSEEIRTAQRLQPSQTEDKRPSKRPDLVALTQMRENGWCINVEQEIGEINGVKCGAMFYSRAEMYVIGLHKHWLAGICARKASDTNDGKALATSIVASGNYEDDEDNGDTLVYTGQGANNLLGNRRQIGDQKLVAGNLALFNSFQKGTPVRVIRGHKNVDSYTKKVYTYDGLYKVIAWRPEQGESKHIVYKFTLQRLLDQPLLTTERVFFSKQDQLRKMTPFGRRLRILSDDISGGLEPHCVPVVCDPDVDERVEPPPAFTYITSSKKPADYEAPKAPMGCKCVGGCSHGKAHKCPCAGLNGGEFPYVDDGRLQRSASAVYECNPNCACASTCMNRVSQRGPTEKLEVFRTESKGWGLRSWSHIAQGTVVCEYIGEQLRSCDVDTRDDTYLFDLDTAKISMEMRHERSNKLSLVDDDEKAQFEDVEWCLDAAKYGNIARFINHSCDPNLFVQSVFVEHHDVREPRLFLVAMQNIKPLEELNYDYGYQSNSVTKADGSIKKAVCHCGALSCTGRLY